MDVQHLVPAAPCLLSFASELHARYIEIFSYFKNVYRLIQIFSSVDKPIAKYATPASIEVNEHCVWVQPHTLILMPPLLYGYQLVTNRPCFQGIRCT